MIEFQISQSDLVGVGDHLERVRLAIMGGIRLGMSEGMQELAGAIVAGMPGVGIEERTGNLESSILGSVRVTETEQYIKGEVSSTSAKYRNLGLWLEFGTKFPAKGKGLGRYPQQFLATFAPATKASIAANGHGAFRIAPHPFFAPVSREMFPGILEAIDERIAEAVDATEL